MANELVDKYPNLPGVKVNYEDGNLYTGQQNLQANTQSVLIIGSAIDGPVGEPVSVQAIGGPKAAEKLFGGMLVKKEIETGDLDPNTGKPITKTVKVPHQGNLIRTMYEALNAGNEDVRLLRIAGRRARTDLDVQDIAQAFTQQLGLAQGNISFSKGITLSQEGRLTDNPVEYVRETKQDGTPIKEFSGSSLNNVILSIDTTEGSEVIYFKPNVFRPGDKIEVKFNYNKRNYYEVLHTDADGTLTQDPTDPKYFSSTHRFFSDNIEAGHTINVYVNRISIPQMNASGEYLWRVGKNDPSVADPLHDDYTTTEYQQGGIRFTAAYDQEVTNGVYPDLKASASVSADYFYYDETAMSESNVYDVPGADTTYELSYLPKTEEFSLYYKVGEIRYDLQPKTTDNPNGDYSMVYPPSGSNEKAKVVIRAGAVPIGVPIMASYKTTQQTSSNPKLIVEGLYAGDLYGGIKNIYDPESLYGVTVEVVEDITPDDPSGNHKIIYFTKPETKKLTSRDNALEYHTRELRGITTIREFANYVNNDPQNNIVRLTVEEGGDVSVQGLLPTGRPIHLGEYKNPATGEYELYVDNSKPIDDPDHFPYLGTNGFFDNTSLKSMKDLYEELGGVYEEVEGSLDEYRLVKQGVYDKIENYAVDIIVLAEANLNTPIGQVVPNPSTGEDMIVEDPTKNFGTQLAQHCAVATAKTWETIGVIGVEPVKNATLFGIQEYIDELTNSDINNHYMYNKATGELVLTDEGDPIDIGRYLNVVFGPEVGLSNSKIGNYITSGAVTYAGLISRLNPEVSTTNQTLPIQGLRYSLSEAQMNQLAGGRFVTFEEKISVDGSRRFVVKDGATAAQPDSDYQRLSTVRITHATVQLIRILADPFIGLPNGLAQQNSLATEIQSGLDKLKEKGVLQDFKFSLFTSAKEKVLGNAFITLELVPQFETRKIFTSVALRQSL